MEDVFVIGVGMTPPGRMLDKSAKAMSADAAGAALADVGLEAAALDAVYFSNATQGHTQRRHMIRGEIVMRSTGVSGIPVINKENACAGSSTALDLAMNHLPAGEGDMALALGADRPRAGSRHQTAPGMAAVFTVPMRQRPA